MALPGVGQARLIADTLDELVRAYRPLSVAVIGCAGGNGFDRLTGAGVRRVVGVDINTEYLNAARERYGSALPDLELHAADIQSTQTRFAPVDFIYAALVLEYVDLDLALRSLHRYCHPGATLATLTQLPHCSQGHVSRSPYTSLKKLEPVMRLVRSETLVLTAVSAGFEPLETSILATPAGKEFALHRFRAAPP